MTNDRHHNKLHQHATVYFNSITKSNRQSAATPLLNGCWGRCIAQCNTTQQGNKLDDRGIDISTERHSTPTHLPCTATLISHGRDSGQPVYQTAHQYDTDTQSITRQCGGSTARHLRVQTLSHLSQSPPDTYRYPGSEAIPCAVLDVFSAAMSASCLSGCNADPFCPYQSTVTLLTVLSLVYLHPPC